MVGSVKAGHAAAARQRVHRRSELDGRGEPLYLLLSHMSLTDAQRRMAAVFDRFGTRVAECVCKIAREVRLRGMVVLIVWSLMAPPCFSPPSLLFVFPAR